MSLNMGRPPTTATGAGGDVSTAILRFRRDQMGSGVSRLGRLQPGGRLRVEYDPARLLSGPAAGADEAVIVCHVLFQPMAEQHEGPLQPGQPVVRAGVGATPSPGLFEVPIPLGTNAVELWFERRGPGGTTGWDSRYGQNFRFPLAEQGLPVPEPAVALRPEAIIDPSRIRVVEDAASKQQAGLGASGSRLQTGLSIRATVGAASAPISAWADVHVFDATSELIHAETITLQAPEPQPADVTVQVADPQL